MTAQVFLMDEADGEYGPRFSDAAERWRTLHGGSADDLWRAIRHGPFVPRRVHGELYIDPRSRNGPAAPDPSEATGADPEPERKMPEKVGGVFVHGPDCDCWICDDSEAESEGAA
jgi:hypothetical protein